MPTAGIAVRGVEAFIDLLVCYGLLYVVAAMAGTTTPGGGVYLHNGALTMGAGLCFAYYVVLEATWGATLGKFATNIRVGRENDGGPIGWSAAIIGNVLRPVDGLVLYLVGFIAICVSPKRQRIGDKVAGTIVVRRAVQAASPTAAEKP
jgi:uncharacterized RDD family membrane protein YckC